MGQASLALPSASVFDVATILPEPTRRTDSRSRCRAPTARTVTTERRSVLIRVRDARTAQEDGAGTVSSVLPALAGASAGPWEAPVRYEHQWE